MPQTHLGRDVALESDEKEADAVEQVVIADVVVRAGRGHGGEPKGVRVWVWGIFRSRARACVAYRGRFESRSRKRERRRLGGLHQRLQERFQVKSSQMFVL